LLRAQEAAKAGLMVSPLSLLVAGTCRRVKQEAVVAQPP